MEELFNIKLLLLTISLSSLFSYFWKVKYLNKYTTLKETPLAKDDGFDLHPDLASDPAPSGFHNYLDEFLSAIRIFGFLEKPVFHELAQHLQTRQLLAGETLNLDDDKSFYIVVDGCVQVFTQTSTPSKARDAYDDEDDNGYQLLNNVESGGTLSSLFTILSLFTEDVQLRYEEEGKTFPNPLATDYSDDLSFGNNKPYKESVPDTPIREVPDYGGDLQKNLDVTDFCLNTESTLNPSTTNIDNVEPSTSTPDPLLRNKSRPLSSDSISTIHERSTSFKETPSESELYFSDSKFNTNDSSSDKKKIFEMKEEHKKQNRFTKDDLGEKLHTGGTIARATVDTTLAVIPAKAFMNLTAKFPNSSAHIVQVILTRLQRVTFLTAHKYLGLTREVVRTEKSINELACYPLSETFWQVGGRSRFHKKFQDEKNITHLPKEVGSHDSPNQRSEELYDPIIQSLPSRDGNLKPGKVFLASEFFSKPSSTTKDALTRDQDDYEEQNLKEAVMESISKAIGLSVQTSRPTPIPSANTSPLVRPQDEYLQKAVFNSSFGPLSFSGLHGQDDESSVAESSIASFSAVDIENEVDILYFSKGSTLVTAGEKAGGLFFVIEGFLDVSIPGDEGSLTMPSTQTQGSQDNPIEEPKPRLNPFLPPLNKLPGETNRDQPVRLFTVKAGGIAGYLSSLTGFPSYVDITAKTDCYVGFLPAKALEKIMDKKPLVLLTLAKRLISLLSPLILHIDSGLEWMQVSAGQVIYRQGDPSKSFYIVINGRLRSITESASGGVNIEGEYGQGESVGELDCITASIRPETVHAIRESELVRIPMTLFNAISVRHPSVTIQISRMIASRVRQQLNRQKPLSIPASLGKGGMNDMGKNNFNLKTIAILPINRHVPASEFASRLHSALELMGAKTSFLNQANILQVLGRHAFSKMGTLKLAGWLSETEQKFRIVLYVADTAVSPWTRTCIQKADCILLVGDGGTEPDIGEYEKLLLGMKTTARKELVLLHSERNILPGTTRPWLKNRPWIHAHHHVEMEGATVLVARSDSAGTALRSFAKKVEIQIEKYKKRTLSGSQPQRSIAMSDFARLARRLVGKSIGVVLGGGGARGIAHIGALQALSEQGIPIDMIGGTSIGSFIGGLYAREGDLVSTYGRAKRFSGRMSTLWRIVTDLTYPLTAWTTGHEFNRGIYKSFYDLHIEDMWLPFFCNTTNITHSRMEVHTTGYAWRFIRASMSLAGLLPPLCDDGNMLVDGGYVDNLPVSTMLSMGAASIFAVDVGSVDDTLPRNYGETVSGWYVLFQRWNPFTISPNIPSITEIQSRLTYVSSVKTLEEAKAYPSVLYMRMPVTQFGTMEFKRFSEILEVGHLTAKQMIKQWETAGKIPSGLEGDINQEQHWKRDQRARRNSI